MIKLLNINKEADCPSIRTSASAWLFVDLAHQVLLVLPYQESYKAMLLGSNTNPIALTVLS